MGKPWRLVAAQVRVWTARILAKFFLMHQSLNWRIERVRSGRSGMNRKSERPTNPRIRENRSADAKGRRATKPPEPARNRSVCFELFREFVDRFWSASAISVLARHRQRVMDVNLLANATPSQGRCLAKFAEIR